MIKSKKIINLILTNAVLATAIVLPTTSKICTTNNFVYASNEQVTDEATKKRIEDINNEIKKINEEQLGHKYPSITSEDIPSLFVKLNLKPSNGQPLTKEYAKKLLSARTFINYLVAEELQKNDTFMDFFNKRNNLQEERNLLSKNIQSIAKECLVKNYNIPEDVVNIYIDCHPLYTYRDYMAELFNNATIRQTVQIMDEFLPTFLLGEPMPWEKDVKNENDPAREGSEDEEKQMKKLLKDLTTIEFDTFSGLREISKNEGLKKAIFDSFDAVTKKISTAVANNDTSSLQRKFDEFKKIMELKNRPSPLELDLRKKYKEISENLSIEKKMEFFKASWYHPRIVFPMYTINNEWPKHLESLASYKEDQKKQHDELTYNMKRFDDYVNKMNEKLNNESTPQAEKDMIKDELENDANLPKEWNERMQKLDSNLRNDKTIEDAFKQARNEYSQMVENDKADMKRRGFVAEEDLMQKIKEIENTNDEKQKETLRKEFEEMFKKFFLPYESEEISQEHNQYFDRLQKNTSSLNFEDVASVINDANKENTKVLFDKVEFLRWWFKFQSSKNIN